MSFALGFFTGMVFITFPCFVSAILILFCIMLFSVRENYEGGCPGCAPPIKPESNKPSSPCMGPCNVNEDCQAPCQSCSKALKGKCVPTLRS